MDLEAFFSVSDVKGDAGGSFHVEVGDQLVADFDAAENWRNEV